MLGRQVSRWEAVAALDAFCRLRLIRIAELAAYTDRRHRMRGTARLRDRVGLVDPGAESPMETRLRILLADAGLTGLICQFEVFDEAGRFIGRADLALVPLRLAFEYEGDHHRGRDQFRRDVTRLNGLQAAGWLVLRFTADDVIRRPHEVVRAASTAVRERRRSQNENNAPW